MTPKNKAEQMLKQYSSQTYQIQPYAGANYETEEIGYEAGKKCALAAAYEVLTLIALQKGFYDEPAAKYWAEVKEQLNAL